MKHKLITMVTVIVLLLAVLTNANAAASNLAVEAAINQLSLERNWIFPVALTSVAGADLRLFADGSYRLDHPTTELSQQGQWQLLSNGSGITLASSDGNSLLRLGQNQLLLLSSKLGGAMEFKLERDQSNLEPKERTELISEWRPLQLNQTRLTTASTANLKLFGNQYGAITELVGFSGCNDFSASVSMHAGKFSIGTIVATLKGCNAELAEFEQQYFSALNQGVNYQIKPQELLIYNQDRNQMVRFILQQPASLATDKLELTGSSWQLTNITVADQTAAPQLLAAARLIKLSFSIDTKAQTYLHGNAGCNNYSAGYQQSAQQQLQVGLTISTRMHCGDEIMALENQYFDALQQVSSYQISSTELRLFDRQQRLLALFARLAQ